MATETERAITIKTSILSIIEVKDQSAVFLVFKKSGHIIDVCRCINSDEEVVLL